MPYRDMTLGVAYGLGVDSTAMLVGMHNRGIRPDFILFADTGSEHDETYAYLPTIQAWLKRVEFPEVTVVRRNTSKLPYTTIEMNMVMNRTLPGAAFNMGSCTTAWKIDVQDKWVRAHYGQHLNDGHKILKAIGFDNGECYRTKKAADKAHTSDDKHYTYWYPLQEWKWERAECEQAIVAAGLPVPHKSSCWFCPNMKTHEVDALPQDKLVRIIRIERAAGPFNHKIKGLWRNGIKKRGMPGSITQYILDHNLLKPETKLLSLPPMNPKCVERRLKDMASGKREVVESFRPPHIDIDPRLLQREIDQWGAPLDPIPASVREQAHRVVTKKTTRKPPIASL